MNAPTRPETGRPLSSEPLEPDAVLRDLRSLGVVDGDLVMVHVSLRAVGPLRGGAQALVDVLDRAVGPTGTLLVTMGALDDWDWVNDEPVDTRAALLAGSPPFDAATTRADPDVGVFAEVFRTTPGTVVSDHPEGRFGARGRLAAELTTDVPWDDYYGPGSPLERFVVAGGKVLRLGADDDTTTLIHLAEHLVPLPGGKRRVRRHRVVHGDGGPVVRTIDTLDDTDGIADYDVDGDEFAAILHDYLATRDVAAGTVGNAASVLIDGGDLVDFAIGWIMVHATPPVPPGSSEPAGQGSDR